jgi:NAD(P)-dependent dehydrogenase (short-subunit alcohol dehydrogenase family)
MELGNVIITGGASGLGAATVESVTRHGGTPLVIDRKEPAADVAFVQVDLADTEAVDAAVRALAEAVDGQIHGVFTAAGIDSCGKLGAWMPNASGG